MREQIQIAMIKKSMALKTLAERSGKSIPNLSQILKRDNLREKEMRELADILGYDLRIQLVDRETGEVLES